ncbi:choice-of-anchor E domain-containing protein [Moorena sp. SIO2C4]|uniref:choice-of-anchor E domain-containing protein n=1 Tax=Moorena sp. SIO2C4 TaxID=2607824 RepID=UPI0013C600CB|nr:choice-of-anchor E domain-containing protein [Moorena sp. SIO2C4]NES42014.1 choice-of-anchor E domain-containing protein [Moorena sp. SIO2C4]
MKSLFNYLQGIRYHSSDSSGASEVNSDWQPLGFNLMGITNLAKATFPILVTGSALLVATPTPVAAQLPSRTCSQAFADFDWSQLSWTNGDLGPRTFTANGVTYTVEVKNPNNHSFTDNSPKLGNNNFNQPALYARPNMVGGGYIEFEVTMSRPVTGVQGIVDAVDEQETGGSRWQDEVVITGFNGSTTVTPTLVAFDPSKVSVVGNVATGQSGSNFSTGGGHGADVEFGFGDQAIDKFVVRYRPGSDVNQSSAQHVTLNNWSFCADVVASDKDFGDAPDTGNGTSSGNYNTLLSDNGPSHDIDGSTYLGSGVTADTDGFGDGTDNNNNATDDTDDGVQINSASLQGQTLPISDNVRLDITTAGSGVLNAWIDWNADGDFDDSGEQIATNASPSGNAIALNLTVPAGATVGNTYARFLYSSDTGLTPTGAASDGEVEDYQIAIANSTPTTASVGDQVWEDLDGDGIQDPGEPGIPNALVNIYKSDNTLVDATFTDSSGNYSFSDLDPGDYIIEFTSPAVGYSFTRQDAGDDTLDSDADPVTGRTDTFTLAAGDNNTSIDAGLTLKANTIVACDIIPLQATNWTETLNVEKFDSALGSLARVDLTLSTLIAQELIYENTADQPKTITVNQEGEVSVSLPDTNANITRNYNQSTDFNLPAFDGSDPPDFSGTSGGRTPTILAYETHTEEYTNLADFISSSSPVETVSIPVNTTSAATFINSQNASTGSSSEATAGLCVTYTYSLVPKEPSASIVPEEASPEAGNIVINEVLYAQTGSSAEANDEFIELYNSSDNAVDISNWKLADSNLIFNSTDNTGNITGDAANPAYIFPNNTTLQPGEYAVIWIGNNTSDHQAPDAAFQDWLGKAAKLNNAGEDIWLYDEEFKIVDYIAYGSNNAINTPPSAELNLWDDTYQRDLDGASTGQSISLTPNGEDGNTSACWEHTLSNDANGRCPEFLETRDTDTVSVRQTSVGVYNNILPNVILVKRITAIKPKDTNQWIELPQSGSPFIDGIDGGSSENNVGSDRAADDNDPNWPNPDVYLRGLINSGQVMPGDELEYTVYFLSNGSNDAKNLRICDRVPGETTFITDSFNATAGFPSSDVGIALFQSTTTLANGGPAEPNIYLTNIPDSDRGRYYGPGTSVPAGCNVTFNQNGVVVVEVGDVPNADSPGNPPNSYGFIRFRALVK